MDLGPKVAQIRKIQNKIQEENNKTKRKSREIQSISSSLPTASNPPAL